MCYMMKFITYALAFLIVLGVVGTDAYLILEWLKQPAVLWLHLAVAWIVAVVNLAFLFFATLFYNEAENW